MEISSKKLCAKCVNAVIDYKYFHDEMKSYEVD